MNKFIIAQIFGALGVIFSVLSAQMKTKKNIMIMLLLVNLASAISFWLLDGISGTLICLFSIFETFINYLYDEKNKKVPTYIIAFYIIITLVLGCISYTKPLDILPVICALIYCITICTKKESIIRIEMLINQPLWLVYNVLVKSYLFIISNILTFISLIISY